MRIGVPKKLSRAHGREPKSDINDIIHDTYTFVSSALSIRPAL
ncbi:MAG: hypothetical protein ABI231_00425 [Candidatus Tumulicola sp.]